MYTEDQAKAKWCPFANAHGDSMLRGVVRDGDRNWQHTLCIASACMAWRWELTKAPLSKERERAAGMALALAIAFQPTIYERGYCGALGRASGAPPTEEENAA